MKTNLLVSALLFLSVSALASESGLGPKQEVMLFLKFCKASCTEKEDRAYSNILNEMSSQFSDRAILQIGNGGMQLDGPRVGKRRETIYGGLGAQLNDSQAVRNLSAHIPEDISITTVLVWSDDTVSKLSRDTDKDSFFTGGFKGLGRFFEPHLEFTSDETKDAEALSDGDLKRSPLLAKLHGKLAQDSKIVVVSSLGDNHGVHEHDASAREEARYFRTMLGQTDGTISLIRPRFEGFKHLWAKIISSIVVRLGVPVVTWFATKDLTTTSYVASAAQLVDPAVDKGIDFFKSGGLEYSVSDGKIAPEHRKVPWTHGAALEHLRRDRAKSGPRLKIK